MVGQSRYREVVQIHEIRGVEAFVDRSVLCVGVFHVMFNVKVLGYRSGVLRVPAGESESLGAANRGHDAAYFRLHEGN